MTNKYLFFAEKLDELSELCNDKALEMGARSKNLAHILLREQTPEFYRIFVDMARLGYKYSIPSSTGILLNFVGTKAKDKIVTHINPQKAIPCALFCKSLEWRHMDYFLKKLKCTPYGHETEIYYVGGPEIMEAIGIAVEKGGPSCEERFNDGHRLCFDANNIYKLNKQDFVGYLMDMVTEKGKHNYFELRNAAFQAAGTKELGIEAAIELMMEG
ncbi:MAG: hypothetical protein PHC66_01985 [Candidatus Nanoarchaeia archaeon]|nr:hypothetical protein [Candidatus Nanoarchaeia archaeon]MDD5239058.1 hypothetical protein [Candidatus Nanoarchaeia archaeon]